MKRVFLSEIKKIIGQYPDLESDVITEEDIGKLPTPVKKYFRYCGYVGKNKMMNAEILWHEAYHRRTQKSNWMKLSYYQFNSAFVPTRIVHIYTRLIGIIPMNIIEKYQDGIGSWQMKVLKTISLIDVKAIKELNESALVTFLSEALLVPTIALQPYITWFEVDCYTAKAMIKYNGNEVSGIFRFNERGEFIEFETDDRYNSENGKIYNKCKWLGMCSNYTEKNGVKYPTEFKAVWKTDEESFEYFNGKIKEIYLS